MNLKSLSLLAILLAPIAVFADAGSTDPSRDILVTFDNRDAGAGRAGVDAPYKYRKRYSISASARRHSRAIAKEYDLQPVDHWPIKSLDVYCFVYRVADPGERVRIIERLQQDDRVESAQALQSFETSASPGNRYDDTYVNLQHGLAALGVTQAHAYSTGDGVRIAIIDSDADTQHEDLTGRLRNTVDLTDSDLQSNTDHGTAVASIIGANTNNATGIVGVAPESKLELFVSCWHDPDADKAVCDSFTLAKALDALLEKPPQVLNLSLTGPFDPLLNRLLHEVLQQRVVVIAAQPDALSQQNRFPSMVDGVIGVASSPLSGAVDVDKKHVYAPGTDILVALPNNNYDLRSGSSLAAAHVSGIVALLLAVSPELEADRVHEMLRRSQLTSAASTSVNACELLRLAGRARLCEAPAASDLASE